MINSITGKTNDKSTAISSIKVDNIERTDSHSICNEFGKYFSTVGQKLAKKIGKSNTSIHEYIEKITRNERSIFLNPCTGKEILDLINKLQGKKSSGHDGVSNVLVKELKYEPVTPLEIIFNNSLLTGQFPTLMKHAEVVPLFKSRFRNQTTNYRPISLLITISKILEKLVYNRIYNFLDKDQLFESQYGFRTNHSCENAITELLAKIVKGWENKQSTIAVFLDLSKAFDTLEHTVLYKKLDRYGIRGTVLDWFKSYLSDRTLAVRCTIKETGQSEISKDYPVDYGSPQGSCLGPLIFLIFGNDLYRILEWCNCILFADDTTIYNTHSDQHFLQWSINEDLKLVHDWFKANKLTLNTSKTVCMLFNQKTTTAQELEIKIDQTVIPRVQHTKFLGVHIDECLNWQMHFNKLCLKIKRNTSLLRAGFNHLNKQSMWLLYFAQIYSHLSYGISIWGNLLNQANMSKLQKLQNKCVSLILRKKSINKSDYAKNNLL